MTQLEQLEEAVKVARYHLDRARSELHEFLARPENNVFDSLEEATFATEQKLLDEARENLQECGDAASDTCTQEFIVSGVMYVGTLEVKSTHCNAIDEYQFSYDMVPTEVAEEASAVESTLAPVEPAEAPAAPIPASAEATMRLGEINSHLAPLSITAEGLRQLGFIPFRKDRAAVLYRANDLGLICRALIRRLQGIPA